MEIHFLQEKISAETRSRKRYRHFREILILQIFGIFETILSDGAFKSCPAPFEQFCYFWGEWKEKYY